MTGHIIWAVVWFFLMLGGFYGGIIAAWLSGIGTVILKDRPTAKDVSTGFFTGLAVLILTWAFAVFAAIKMVLQIVAAFHS